jgi:nucleoid DNA-binding protein
MASTTLNLMDSIENPNGRVSVKLQRNYFSKDSSDKYVGRAVRNTHTVGNVLQLVANKVPQLDIGTVYSVCDALEKVITESLGNGNSVNCLNLGIFYIACKGSTDGKSISPSITVKFIPSDLTKSAISNVTVAQESYAEPIATISQIVDVDTGSSNGILSLNGSVQITGKKLLIGGEDSGIWFAPATGKDAVIDESGADWTQVTAKFSVNRPGTLLFPLPKTLEAGKYRIILKTRCPWNLKYARKEIVTTISDAFVIQ